MKFLHNSIQIVRTELSKNIHACCEIPSPNIQTVPFYNEHTFNERAGLPSRSPPSFYTNRPK